MRLTGQPNVPGILTGYVVRTGLAPFYWLMDSLTWRPLGREAARRAAT